LTDTEIEGKAGSLEIESVGDTGELATHKKKKNIENILKEKANNCPPANNSKKKKQRKMGWTRGWKTGGETIRNGTSRDVETEGEEKKRSQKNKNKRKSGRGADPKKHMVFMVDGYRVGGTPRKVGVKKASGLFKARRDRWARTWMGLATGSGRPKDSKSVGGTLKKSKGTSTVPGGTEGTARDVKKLRQRTGGKNPI